jgi:hypothetical protein
MVLGVASIQAEGFQPSDPAPLLVHDQPPFFNVTFSRFEIGHPNLRGVVPRTISWHGFNAIFQRGLTVARNLLPVRFDLRPAISISP